MSINTKNVAMYKIPSNEINLERAASRNAINFMDRTKIKATKVVNLKLFDEEDKILIKMNLQKFQQIIKNILYLEVIIVLKKEEIVLLMNYILEIIY